MRESPIIPKCFPKGYEKEQYAFFLGTQRAGGWCEPVSQNAELALEPPLRTIQ